MCSIDGIFFFLAFFALMASPDTHTQWTESLVQNNIKMLVYSIIHCSEHVSCCACSQCKTCVSVIICACVQARVSRWAQKAGGHSTLHRLVLHVRAYRAAEPHVHKQSFARPPRIKVGQRLRQLFIVYLTVWGVEPVVTHQTSWLESTIVCRVRQGQAGGSSVRKRA